MKGASIEVEPDFNDDYGVFGSKENIIANLTPIMKNGLRIYIGFKTQSYYAVSAPGGWRLFKDYLNKSFCKYLAEGYSIKSAWINLIKEYTDQVNTETAPIISRVLCHKNATEDKLMYFSNDKNLPLEVSSVPQNDTDPKNYKMFQCGNFNIQFTEEME